MENSGNFEKRLIRIKEFLINEQDSKWNTEEKKIWAKFKESAVKIASNGEDDFDLVEETTTKLSGLDNFKNGFN
ncbi:uncharacterized protein OCT59_017720 [Rhizophagus irregularis]|uniref:Uncharacterized protein n=1 Tax=Rhizophagus irregularis (strain DAOM 197198w) TaxID=1432141 RepID=A0A015MX70_RHIIW|nr:hypothetical protein RirG_078900 [Rhizophagus irregularis DAOM 197198w]UZO25455.1 hypothetical protein OCT59_017720 [Rhizophagus irregularis]GBC46654.1 hypothetical protein GLOIN_2v1782521 [Rhizophagus irregularis DAOM 181602=DAOM 197198]